MSQPAADDPRRDGNFASWDRTNERALLAVNPFSYVLPYETRPNVRAKRATHEDAPERTQRLGPRSLERYRDELSESQVF